MRYHLLPSLLSVLLLAGSLGAQDSVAVYDVELDATWSAATHGINYPFGAHFSALTGSTHDDTITFWSLGALASPAIEQVAELGATGSLQSLVSFAIVQGRSASFVLSPVMVSSPGSVSTTIVVSERHPLVTLLSMIAPSPDWFVGVSGLSLLEGGQWIEQLEVPLLPLDAGSDNGPSFTSHNWPANPPEPIAYITSGPLAGGMPLGILRFQRRMSTLVYGTGNPANSLTVLGGLPSLGQTLTIGLSDPSGTLATPASTFLVASDAPSPFFPSGILVPNVGLGMPGTPGELLLGGNIVESLSGASWTGTTVVFQVPIPNLAGLVDARFYLQGILAAPTPRFGLTEALELRIGP